MKNKIKIVIAFILGLIVASSITTYATIKLQASEIEYNDTPLDQVLDDLYNQSSSKYDRLYLYWKGRTFDNITGGWGSPVRASTAFGGTSISYKEPIYNTDNINLKTDSTFQYSISSTNNKIDCVNYHYAVIYYVLHSAYYYTVFRVDTTNQLGEVTSYDSGQLMNGYVTSSLKYITLPITCNEDSYVGFSVLRGASQDSITDLKIYGIYLIKDFEPIIN